MGLENASSLRDKAEGFEKSLTPNIIRCKKGEDHEVFDRTIRFFEGLSGICPIKGVLPWAGTGFLSILIYTSALIRNFGSVCMGSIFIPFVISSKGIGDSILKTVEVWVLFFGAIVIFCVIYGLVKGEIPLPRVKITAGKMIAAVLIAAAGVVAFSINPLLILPLLGVVLALLVYLEVSSMNPDKGSGYNDQDPVSRYQYSRAGTYGDRVVNAEFRVVDEPEKEELARPVKTVSVPDTADQKKAKEQRSLYEEQKKKELAQELRARELERLKYIHGFYSTQYLEYLHEAEIFRKEFGKNVKCDVCGRWDGELFVHRSQTYCSQCLPGGSHPGHDRAVVAGKHGASIDHIKK
jgi:hypothetical protein